MLWNAPGMDEAHRQREYGVRFDWGLQGALAVAADVDIAVVVDVLSFTTTVTVALAVNQIGGVVPM